MIQDILELIATNYQVFKNLDNLFKDIDYEKDSIHYCKKENGIVIINAGKKKVNFKKDEGAILEIIFDWAGYGTVWYNPNDNVFYFE
ncbi:MAG: hypothetical protein ACP5G1_04305 [Nanopusillaceae archaeon]